jgi:hypothetical protein
VVSRPGPPGPFPGPPEPLARPTRLRRWLAGRHTA